MRERLDKILVSKGLVRSRENARALVIEGKVFVDGRRIDKPGTLVNEGSDILLKEGSPYVSRGGLKLDAALDFFGIDVKGMVAMDVGSSTGGFTDCLLRRGVKKIYCIDVGYGQLAWSLRNDPRVVVMERTNARYIDSLIETQPERFRDESFKDLLNAAINIIVADVSFISLTKVLPAAVRFLREKGEVLALVKPQFEVGKGEVGKGGIVREREKRISAVVIVREDLEKLGLRASDIFESPVAGQKGNIEYFLHMRKS